MQLSISHRLNLMVASSAIALLTVGITSMLGAARLESGLKETNTDTLPAIAKLQKMERNIGEMRTNVLLFVLTTSAAAKNDYESKITDERREFEVLIKEYEALVTTERDKELLSDDKLAMFAYRAGVSKVFRLAQEEDTEKVRTLIQNELRPLTSKLSEALKAHANYRLEQAKLSAEQSASFAHTARAFSIAAIALGLIAISAIGLLTIRSIRRSLSSMQTLIERIENQQDFTARAQIHNQDEIGYMAGLLNRLIEKLQGNLKSIAQSTHKVSAASANMAATSHEVARASDQQSAAASNMAAAIEELTVSIAHVGDRAHDANAQSTKSGQLAESGTAVIDQTVSDINEIAETVNTASARIRELETQSDRISSVVSVIREVADQTNLLALNAAIEAARAGEQGRGFAVVADEVRKLAERTATSTKEITSMVESVRHCARNAVESMGHAVQRVSAGVTRAAEASTAIRQIGESSGEAVGMVNEITHAIREQRAASTSIAKQVENIAHMAEESNATAGQSAQSAKELDALAAGMQRIVSEYRL